MSYSVKLKYSEAIIGPREKKTNPRIAGRVKI
jgi:hypothetical protein